MATIEQSETTVVTLTARAATKVQGLMAAEPAGEAEVLRVAIQGGGCSGFEYALGFDRGAQSGDHELEFHGVKVVVDPFSAPYLQGSTIDFLETLQESGFKIENPNATTACGCGHGPDAVAVEERVAVFDNDGTLWCEKPMPIQLDFILRRLVTMATAQPELQQRQPWQAAFDRDYAWFGQLMADHYAGDDTNVRTLAGGILAAYQGISVEDFEAQSDEFLRSAQHPTLGRGYLETAYAPMVELLGYLEANGFSNYIASGGGRDFMRPISHEVYGIPRERVIGSSSTFEYTSDHRGGTITHKA